MKYVRHETKGFFLFPKSDEVWHSHVGEFLGRGGVISAGFVRQKPDGTFECYGRSESLYLGGLEGDDEALNLQMMTGLGAGSASDAAELKLQREACASAVDSLAHIEIPAYQEVVKLVNLTDVITAVMDATVSTPELDTPLEPCETCGTPTVDGNFDCPDCAPF